MRSPSTAWLGALVLALLTLSGTPVAAPLHDALGHLVPSPRLPVAVVQITSAPGAARASAEAAGARAVWMALPAGDARLEGASADPGTLRPGRDGRIRFDGEARLALPEGIDGLLVLGEDQIGEGTPPQALADRDVVLVWADPTLGARVAAPGHPVVDRGLVLAVALGGGTLSVLPAPLAAALVLALTLGQGLLARRWMPQAALAGSLAVVPVVLGIAALARWGGLDLPVGGLCAGVLLPPVLRVFTTAAEALDVLDRLVLWLGPPPQEPAAPAGVESVGAMLAAWLPEARVVAWRGSGGSAVQAGAWGEGAEPPPLDRLPVERAHGDRWCVEPVLDRGEVVGAVGVATSAPLEGATRALVSLVALAGGRGAAAPRAASDDPMQVRVDLARAAVQRAMARAERWEAVLRDTRAPIAVYDLAGNLVSGSEALRARSGDPRVPALLDALANHARTPAPAEAARTALVTGAPVRLPGHAGAELILLPLRGPAGPLGFLLQILLLSPDPTP